MSTEMIKKNAVFFVFLSKNTHKTHEIVKVAVYVFLFLAHVIDLEKTHLAAEFQRSVTFSLGAMGPFRIFVKCETGK